jgi:hypothetical protein
MLITVVYFKTSVAKNSLDNSPLWRTRRAAGHPRLFLPTDDAPSDVAWRIIVVKALAYSFIYVVDSGIYHFSVVFRRNASQQLDLLIKTLSLKTRVNRELNSENWHISSAQLKIMIKGVRIQGRIKTLWLRRIALLFQFSRGLIKMLQNS